MQSKLVCILGALVLALSNSAVTAADSAANATGAMPGDEALSCEQIYAQGLAESQRDQQALARRNEQLKAQNAGAVAITSTAYLTGGLFAGPAAQKALEAHADRQVAMLSEAPSNPRKEHLRQLWTQKQCAKK